MSHYNKQQEETASNTHWRWAFESHPHPSIEDDYKEYAKLSDPVNHPKHYTSHPSGVEVIQITEHMNFCLGNVVKYVLRHEGKNGLEDLKKAQWYLNREIERRENGK